MTRRSAANNTREPPARMEARDMYLVFGLMEIPPVYPCVKVCLMDTESASIKDKSVVGKVDSLSLCRVRYDCRGPHQTP